MGLGQRLALERFWFLEFETKVKQRKRGYNANAQTDAPSDSQMVFACDDDDDRGDDCADEKGQVDLDVGEEDKPLVS